MKRYEIMLDEPTSKFFEDIAVITHRPIEELLSDALFKQVEIICQKMIKLSEFDEK